MTTHLSTKPRPDQVKKTSTTGGVSVTTRYVGALEIRSNGTTILDYDGVAFRTVTGSTNVLTYVHGNHLGSVSLTTNTNGVASPLQTFDPWGAVRSGTITSTEWNYTNQRKDAGTGLLFYTARYYDPALGRFLQADSIVPGSADGTGGAAATLGYDDTQSLRPLTVDFHEKTFLETVNTTSPSNKGFGFN